MSACQIAVCFIITIGVASISRDELESLDSDGRNDKTAHALSPTKERETKLQCFLISFLWASTHLQSNCHPNFTYFFLCSWFFPCRFVFCFWTHVVFMSFGFESFYRQTIWLFFLSLFRSLDIMYNVVTEPKKNTRQDEDEKIEWNKKYWDKMDWNWKYFTTIVNQLIVHNVFTMKYLLFPVSSNVVFCIEHI